MIISESGPVHNLDALAEYEYAMIEFSPPTSPNGDITHYHVSISNGTMTTCVIIPLYYRCGTGINVSVSGTQASMFR